MTGDLDRALAGLTQAARWHMWMRRVEAVLFASAAPVTEVALHRVVGEEVSVALIIEDLMVDLADRPYEVIKTGDGWMMRTRPAYADAVQAAADVGGQDLDLSPFDTAVLAAVAYHQPVTREGLKDIFGTDISRDLIGRLHGQGLITTGPRSPRRGAPYTYVTTDKFLLAFDLRSLRDLPDREQLADAGLLQDAKP